MLWMDGMHSFINLSNLVCAFMVSKDVNFIVFYYLSINDDGIFQNYVVNIFNFHIL